MVTKEGRGSPIIRDVLHAMGILAAVELPLVVSKNPLFEFRQRFMVSSRVIAKAQSMEALRALDWELLRQKEPGTKRPATSVRELNGKRVSLRGFMVPLQDLQAETTEFLLVPSPMSCVHVPPPPEEQVVLVQMGETKRAKVVPEAITVIGTFYVASTPFGTAGAAAYTLAAESAN